MTDAYDRRALLLHLGDVLEAIRRLTVCSPDQQLVCEAVAAHGSLKNLPLLTQVSPRMHTREFVEKAVAAFVAWPTELLKPELDREQLARTVQRSLFSDNPAGWQAYAALRREAVAWFGTGVDPAEVDRRGEGVTNDDADLSDPVDRDAPVARPNVGDIERDGAGQSPAPRESIESDDRRL
jgi:hypothetical protein